MNPLCPPEWDFFALDGVRYHGCDLQILWDRTGEKYKRGRGLQIIADGRVLARRVELGRLSADLQEDRGAPQAAVREVNHAVNAESLPFPKAAASFCNAVEGVNLPIQGSCWYDPTPVNRWTSRGSREPSHWFEVRFEQPCRIQRIVACFYEDELGIKPPKCISLVVWTGNQWKVVYGSDDSVAIRARCATHLGFAPISTDRVRLLMVTQQGSGVGLAAFEAWG